MYATLEEGAGLTAARAYAARRARAVQATAALPLLEEQVCAEAGVWAPDAARRALAQSAGDLPAAVALVRVWAAALTHVEAEVVADDDVHLVRRLSATFPAVPGGQWLGLAPELGSRLLDWTVPTTEDEQISGPVTAVDGYAGDAPSRSVTPRVRQLVEDVPVASIPEDGPGADPARAALTAPFSRATRMSVLARADTSSLVTLASLVLAQRREAVLAELTVAEVDVRLPHPRTGAPCRAVTLPVVEAEAVLDALVDEAPGFAIGWGASLGSLERRGIALSLLDGAAQAGDRDLPALRLDEQTVVAATDGAATNGFVEHLRLPHYASFASYLSQARRPAPGGQP